MIRFLLFPLLLCVVGSVNAATLIIDQVGSPFRSGGWTGGRVIQSFTPSQQNIAGIDVDFYNFNGTKDLTLKLWREWDSSNMEGVGPVLVDLSLRGLTACGSNNDLACQEFRFSAFAITPNEMLFMELLWDTSGLPGGAIGGGRTNPGGDLYTGGELFCATNCGNTANADAAFRSYGVSNVPIPAAAWLFGSALLGLGAIKRKKA